MARKPKDPTLSHDPLMRMAVLKSLETSAGDAAIVFGLDPNELLEAQRLFLDAKMEVHQPKPVVEEAKPPGLLERVYHSGWFEVGMKVILTPLLAALFWLLPHVLQKHVDPLTNTIIWAGFTTLFYVSFLSLGVEVLFWVLHNVNFQFFNRHTEKGVWDYESFIKSDKLSYYEKCQLNQQKYLVYLGLSCWVLQSLIGAVLNAG